jgi:hypothetical protein
MLEPSPALLVYGLWRVTRSPLRRCRSRRWPWCVFTVARLSSFGNATQSPTGYASWRSVSDRWGSCPHRPTEFFPIGDHGPHIHGCRRRRGCFRAPRRTSARQYFGWPVSIRSRPRSRPSGVAQPGGLIGVARPALISPSPNVQSASSSTFGQWQYRCRFAGTIAAKYCVEA